MASLLDDPTIDVPGIDTTLHEAERVAEDLEVGAASELGKGLLKVFCQHCQAIVSYGSLGHRGCPTSLSVDLSRTLTGTRVIARILEGWCTVHSCGACGQQPVSCAYACAWSSTGTVLWSAPHGDRLPIASSNDMRRCCYTHPLSRGGRATTVLLRPGTA
ncbi:hypothetical protein J6590_032821 [Homalodisca vitripennis]|nr:hypothetical protein J6590_032821 [Homalodisca vitripennis]